MKALVNLVLLLMHTLASGAVARFATYTFSPVPGNVDALNVELSFTGSRSGSTDIYVPFDLANRSERIDFSASIGSVKLSSGVEGYFYDGANKSPCVSIKKSILRHDPNAKISIKYRLFNGGSGFILRHHGVMFQGGSALILATNDIEKIRFQIKGLHSQSWLISASRSQSAHGVLSHSDVTTMTSWFYFGSLEVARSKIDGSIYDVVTVGTHKDVTHKQLAHLTKQIAQHNQRFIDSIAGKESRPQTMIFYLADSVESSQRMNISGAAYPNFSFVRVPAFKAGKSQKALRLKHTISHEILHQLFPNKVFVDFGSDAYCKHPERRFWYAEGFTDYYALRLNLESGTISKNEYLALLNAKLADYHRFATPIQRFLSSVRQCMPRETNEMCAAIQNGLYTYGLSIALHLDELIRAKTNGTYTLDDLLKRMVSKCPKLRCELTMDNFAQTYAELLQDKDQAEVMKNRLKLYVSDFTVPQLPHSILGGRAVLTYKNAKVVDFGFDTREAFCAGILANVSEVGRLAGLRNGQFLRGINLESLGIASPKVAIEVMGGKSAKYEAIGWALVPEYKLAH